MPRFERRAQHRIRNSIGFPSGVFIWDSIVFNVSFFQTAPSLVSMHTFSIASGTTADVEEMEAGPRHYQSLVAAFEYGNTKAAVVGNASCHRMVTSWPWEGLRKEV